MRQLMTVAEVGRSLDPPLTPAAVRAAANAGRLPVATKTESGVRLFDRADVERFQQERAARRAA
jgi:DNA-binding transcriptional MerR regulator